MIAIDVAGIFIVGVSDGTASILQFQYKDTLEQWSFEIVG